MREIGTITGLRVLTMEEAASLGAVTQVVVDLAQGRVLGLFLSSSAGELGVAAADLQTIGSDVVMVSRREVARPRSEMPELDKFRRPSNAPPLQVFTTSGRRLGAVSAVYIDPLDKTVTRYEVSGGPFKDMAEGVLILPIIAGAVHGQDAVIIPEESVAGEVRETGGLLAKLSNLGQKVRGQVQQTTETVEKVADKSGQVLKKEAAAVKERAGGLAGKARDQAQHTADTVEKAVGKGGAALKKEAGIAKERAGDLAEKARDGYEAAAQTVGKAVGKGAETLKKEAGAVKERAEELTGKAREAVTEALKGEDSKPVPGTEAEPEVAEAKPEVAAAEPPAPTKKRSAAKAASAEAAPGSKPAGGSPPKRSAKKEQPES